MGDRLFEKQQIRKYFASLRRFLVNPDASSLAQRLSSVLPPNASLCAAYVGAKGELDPSPALQLMSNIQWCYPRLDEVQQDEAQYNTQPPRPTPYQDISSQTTTTTTPSQAASAQAISATSPQATSAIGVTPPQALRSKARLRGDMKFYVVDEHTGWSWHRLGFREPIGRQENEVCLHDCAAVLVPGVSFDRRGHRVGSGAGYYDRALRGERCLKIGICYECQLSHEDLPTEEHDIAMDLVVTEKNTYHTASHGQAAQSRGRTGTSSPLRDKA